MFNSSCCMLYLTTNHSLCHILSFRLISLLLSSHFILTKSKPGETWMTVIDDSLQQCLILVVGEGYLVSWGGRWFETRCQTEFFKCRQNSSDLTTLIFGPKVCFPVTAVPLCSYTAEVSEDPWMHHEQKVRKWSVYTQTWSDFDTEMEMITVHCQQVSHTEMNWSQRLSEINVKLMVWFGKGSAEMICS